MQWSGVIYLYESTQYTHWAWIVITVELLLGRATSVFDVIYVWCTVIYC